MAVDDAGEIRIFLSDKLSSPFVFNNNVSTWGISTSNESPYIAVSANSHEITLLKYDLANFGQFEAVMLTGHGNNIPCIDFSNCGNFLGSVSIDSTVKIWQVSSGKMVRSALLGGVENWGWSVKWIGKKSVIVLNREIEERKTEIDDKLNESDDELFENEENDDLEDDV
jgi:WD40 repeat protein